MDEFAKISGVSKAYVSVLEKNKRPGTGGTVSPTITIYNKVANAMGLTVDQLFDKLDPESSVTLQEKIQDNVNEVSAFSPSAKEALTLYEQLDIEDRAEIRGTMKQMLKADKYHQNEESKNA